MASTYYDRVLCIPKSVRASLARDRQRDVDREFGEEMRDPRFRPGWYILLFFGLALVIAAIVIFLL